MLRAAAPSTDRARIGRSRVVGALALMFAGVAFVGCQPAPRNESAIRAYYQYEFGESRDAIRRDLEGQPDEQVLLDHLRVGLAALADGAREDAEQHLTRAFEFLSTAGLNEDRTTAATLAWEGVRVWKGQPFEQALAYTWTATHFAERGDWENARAAASNALFRLRDFDTALRPESLAPGTPGSEDAPPSYETTFAFGYLMQAIATNLSNSGDPSPLFTAVRDLDPRLIQIADTAERGQFNTLIIVDYGKGPTKIAYGAGNARSTFSAQDTGPAQLRVQSRSGIDQRFPSVVDVNAMADDLRWNELEGTRVAKQAIGSLMTDVGEIGLITADNSDNVLASIGLMLAGALTQSGARADIRYLEFAPQLMFLAPIELDGETTLNIAVLPDQNDGPPASIVLPNVVPGTRRAPRAIYVRLHGPDSPAPEWLMSETPRYGNDATGVFPGDYPWILGGTDVSTPSRDVLQSYKAGGHLADWTLTDLIELYRQEGITFGENAGTGRHILDGGTSMRMPSPTSTGFKRLFFSDHPPYVPKSDETRALRSEFLIPGASP